MKRLLPLLLLLACEPQPPFACAQVPELTVFVGEWAGVDLCFEDPEGAQLDLASFVQDTIPLGQVQLTRLGHLRVLARSPGSTIVTITATDPDGLRATVDVPVLVPNRAPTGSLHDFRISTRFRRTIVLTRHFRDPDGLPLYFRASSSAPSVVHAEVSADSLLRLTPLESQGSARISVTVSDGVDSLTTSSEAMVVPPVPVLSDEFDSAASLDHWTLDDYSRAEIEDGYLVLTADSADYNGLASREFGGTASEWLVDITLRTTEADAEAGFLVPTGDVLIGAHMFLLGEADVPGLPPVNWIFMWRDARKGWVTEDWAHGKSGHIRDFADHEVSLSMTRSGIRATVDGKLLFERDWGEGRPVATATGLSLVTRPEFKADVASSVNRVQLIAREFSEDRGPNVDARPGPADGRDPPDPRASPGPRRTLQFRKPVDEDAGAGRVVWSR